MRLDTVQTTSLCVSFSGIVNDFQTCPTSSPPPQHAFDFGLFFSGIPLAVLSRAANIGLCSRLINLW